MTLDKLTQQLEIRWVYRGYTMWQAVSQLLSGHFDQTFTIREKRELPGGEVHQAWCVSDGERQVFIKCDTPTSYKILKLRPISWRAWHAVIR